MGVTAAILGQSCVAAFHCARVAAAPLAIILLAFAPAAYADDVDPWIELPRAHVADLLAKSAELAAVKAQVAALEAVVAAQAKHIDALGKIVALQEQETARQRRITTLADEERDVYKDRAARIEKDAKRGNLSLRVQARAGAGALIGAAAAPIFPPAALLGPVLGAAVGLVEHWLID